MITIEWKHPCLLVQIIIIIIIIGTSTSAISIICLYSNGNGNAITSMVNQTITANTVPFPSFQSKSSSNSFCALMSAEHRLAKWRRMNSMIEWIQQLGGSGKMENAFGDLFIVGSRRSFALSIWLDGCWLLDVGNNRFHSVRTVIKPQSFSYCLCRWVICIL